MKAIQKTVLSLLLLLVVGVLVSCQSVNEPAVQEESSNRKGLGNAVTSSWSFVGDTGFTPDPVGSQLSISTNSSGRPYVAFLRNTAGGFKVMVMRYLGGASPNWFATGGQGFSDGYAAEPHLIINPGSGYPTCAFLDGGHQAPLEVESCYSEFSDNGWGGAQASEDRAEKSSFHIDASTGINYVAFQDNSPNGQGRISVMKRFPTWEYIGTQGFGHQYVNATSLFVYNGTPYLAYNDIFDMVSVMKYNGTSWVYVGSQNFVTSGTVSLYIYNGTPYIALGNRSYGSLKASVMKFNGTSWQYVGNSNFSSGAVRHPELKFYGSTPVVSFANLGNSGKVEVMRYIGGSWTLLGDTGVYSYKESNVPMAIHSDGTIYFAFKDKGIYGYKASVIKYRLYY